MNYADIPKLTQSPTNGTTTWWQDLEQRFDAWRKYNEQVILCPDYQRGHVWSKKQQQAYVEFIIRGGSSARDLWFNQIGYMDSFSGDLELVDGLQRITAVQKFLGSELPVFTHLKKGGYRFNEIGGRLPSHCFFVFHVNNLPTREQVLAWYLELNSGVAHSQSELNRVAELLRKEKS